MTRSSDDCAPRADWWLDYHDYPIVKWVHLRVNDWGEVTVLMATGAMHLFDAPAEAEEWLTSEGYEALNEIDVSALHNRGIKIDTTFLPDEPKPFNELIPLMRQASGPGPL